MRHILLNLAIGLFGAILLVLTLAGAAMIWGERLDLAAAQNQEMQEGRNLIATNLLPATDTIKDQARIANIIRAFDDNPLVSAHLVDPWGFDRLQSVPARVAYQPPSWFVWLVAPKRQEVHIDFGQTGTLHLQPYLLPSVETIWHRTAMNLGAMAGGLFFISVIAIFLVRRSLHVLTDLEQASVRLLSGDEGQMGARSTLGQAFDRLAGKFQETIAQNARLTRMIDRLQEEERSELARNLHDDIGPQLFAVDVDASTIIRQSEQQSPDLHAIAERASAIRASATTMKRHVRQLLGQLRPNEALKLGLEPAVRNLAGYWNERRPELKFGISIASEPHNGLLDGTLYAVIREAIANAVKHGHPRYIDISVDSSAQELRLRVADDGGGAASFEGPGYGVIGMRERVQSVGGRFIIDRRVDVAGVVVAATIPFGQNGHNPIGARQ
ncbi:sensor histidine kinase [Oryzibacter oryziterrae]|uniref:sensor histidine kinase n=1 Tax=Oryzibacter oryziterrae TaxID=2766474 RepID=UPI001F01757A|nr:histidine kinase [Oryzibacter oryziterrae]